MVGAIAVPWWRTRRVSSLLTWGPLALGGAYLVVLATRFSQMVAATYVNADAASAPVIGQLYSSGPPHREVVLGQMAWFSTLIFELATRWLPAHRAIWETAPYAMALVSVALIAWGLAQVAGRWAAAVGGVIALCASPRVLQWLFWLNDHSPTWFSLTLLAALLVLLQGKRRLPTPLLAGAIVLVGVIVGANMASDVLLLVAGLLPALLAAVGAWALRPSRAGLRALGLMLTMALIAGATALLTKAVMHGEGVHAPMHLSHNVLASGEAVVANFKLWWQSITVLGNGDFYGQSLRFLPALQLACAVLALAAVAVIAPRLAWRELGAAMRLRLDRGEGYERHHSYEHAATTPGAHGASTAVVVPREPVWLAWCIFWIASGVLLSLAFMVSSTPVDIESDRYLVGLVYVAAALVPLLGARGLAWRTAVTLGVMVFALTGVMTLLEGLDTSTGTLPSERELNAIIATARGERLSLGYAGYWDAAPVTWASHVQVKVYPVQACATTLCPVGLHYISSWYTPRAGQRSFLIYDPTQPIPSPPVASLGKPVAVHQIGATTMYVYPYDIASRIQP